MKALLEENQRNRQRKEIFQKYWPMIPSIEKFVPESKKEDVEKIKKILKDYEKQPVKMEGGQ